MPGPELGSGLGRTSCGPESPIRWSQHTRQTPPTQIASVGDRQPGHGGAAGAVGSTWPRLTVDAACRARKSLYARDSCSPRPSYGPMPRTRPIRRPNSGLGYAQWHTHLATGLPSGPAASATQTGTGDPSRRTRISRDSGAVENRTEPRLPGWGSEAMKAALGNPDGLPGSAPEIEAMRTRGESPGSGKV